MYSAATLPELSVGFHKITSPQVDFSASVYCVVCGWFGCSKTACVHPGILEVHVEYGRRVLLDIEVVYKVVMRSLWKLRRRRPVGCGRPPLPPQQLMVTAAVLAVAAMAVSLMIVAGGLSWMVPGEEEAARWDRLHALCIIYVRTSVAQHSLTS